MEAANSKKWIDAMRDKNDAMLLSNDCPLSLRLRTWKKLDMF